MNKIHRVDIIYWDQDKLKMERVFCDSEVTLDEIKAFMLHDNEKTEVEG